MQIKFSPVLSSQALSLSRIGEMLATPDAFSSDWYGWVTNQSGHALPAGTKAAEARLWADLTIIANVVKAEAKRRGVMIECGVDWGWDAPHVQLNRKAYP